MAGNQSTSASNNAASRIARLSATFRAVRLEHLFAGITGGVVSTLVLHPLDLLKIRFAVDDGKTAVNRPQYRGLGHAFYSIFKQEGATGLYKGVSPNVFGAGAAWGSYFLFYNTIKTEMQGGDTKKQLTPGMHMLAASEAGLFTLVLTNPIWVVKTRLCLQYGMTNAPPGTTIYKGFIDALWKIKVEEGWKGLYKGFVPGIWGVSHGAVQFMAYEELKNLYNVQYKKQAVDTKLGTGEYLFFACLSKLFAAITTYPYQVIRARMQDQHTIYTSATDCVRQTYRNEGLGGFYKGLKPNLARVIPACGLTFVIYEEVSHFLMDRRKRSEQGQTSPTKANDDDKDTTSK